MLADDFCEVTHDGGERALGEGKVPDLPAPFDDQIFIRSMMSSTVTQAALALAANAADGVLQLDSSGDIPALPLDGVTNGSNAPAGSRHHGL